jgi:hypothetical protein
VILIVSAYNDRTTVAGVAEAISSGNLATVTYDRRGRGASTKNDGDSEPERELEISRAMIEALGGSVREAPGELASKTPTGAKRVSDLSGQASAGGLYGEA